MPKLADLLKELQTNEYVLEVTKLRDIGSRVWISIIYKDKNNDMLVHQETRTIYVLNRGTDQEEAYFMNGLPTPLIYKMTETKETEETQETTQ